ncbi:DNA replication/repair protein RecF [Pararhodonellum marinum]|uniref:DNA replication/repair protein RecF n=1 Tax=Pararhodonellum marinum TaxID=2755358 RepID=UPI00188EC04F|nr:DNA replication/repair protein RecF [Pararhodonellum marinum]
MYLKNILLNQFKNHAKVQFDFSPEINCFLGINGSGKTNLLDAIHYLCLTKSAFNAQDSQNIQHEGSFFSIKGEFERNDKTMAVHCVLEEGKKKQLSLNGKAYERMSDHIGLIPVVLIAPDDTTLIRDGSEERRKFFDSMLCQLDKKYLQQLIQYQHALKQRNALIKAFNEQAYFDKLQIEPYDRQLVKLAKEIFKARDAFNESFEPKLQEHYGTISGDRERVKIHYESDCRDEGFEAIFLNNHKKDILLKRTGLGIHKDDYRFEIDGHPIKKFGSQGQQKSFVIALKLAQFQSFLDNKKEKPILLLDDVFDKLDDLRISKLMGLVAKGDFGQIFMTDARPERSKNILDDIPADKSFFEIQPTLILD